MTKESIVPQTIKLNNAYAPGLIIKGALSQSANLQEWQDSAGTVVASMDASGKLIVPTLRGPAGSVITLGVDGNPYSLSISATQFDSYGPVPWRPYNTSMVGFIVKGLASQTADLIQWQNSAGGVIASIDSLGKITSYNRDTVGGNNNLTIGGYYNGSTSSLDLQSNGITRVSLISSGTIGTDASFRIHTRINDVLSERFRIATSGRFGFNTNSPSSAYHFVNTASADIGAIIRGAASQTADLQQWQNSAGTVLASVSADGYLNIPLITQTGTNAYISFGSGGNPGFIVTGGTAAPISRFISGNAASITMQVRGAASQTANLQEWQNSAGTVLASVDSTGGIIIKPSSASVTPLIIQASPTYPAAIQQWQNSSGTTLAQFRFNGSLDLYDIAPLNSNSGTYLSFSSSALTAVSRATATSTLVVKAAASQTANIQEWQNSAGTVLSFIRSDGFIRADASLMTPTIYSPTSGGTQVNLGTAWTYLINAAANVGLIVKGAASQTANLQEWQDSTGAVIAKLDPAGGFTTGTPATTNIKLDATAAGAKLYFGTPATFNNYATLGAYSSVFNIEANARSILATVTNSTTTTTLIVKANTSQTANLQEWQNSAGTVLAKVTAAGDINIDISQGGSFHAQASGGQVGDYNLIKMSQTSTQKTTLLTTVVSGGNTEFSVKTLIGSLTTTLKIDKDSLVGIGKDNTSPLAQIDVRPQSASTVGAIIRGAASQSANLQQWQNSAGTVLTNISSTGKLTSVVDASINGMTVGLGNSALANTAIGVVALTSNTTGVSNTAIGNNNLAYNTTGNQNVGLGHYTLYLNTTGQNNTAIGTNALLSNITGSNNTALGNYAGWNNLGSNNIFIGNNAGLNETGSSKLYIANSSTSTPLIGGDFSAKTLTVAGNATITSQATGTVGLIVKAIASQSADLQQWQNSDGTVNARIDAYGTFQNGTATGYGAWINVQPALASDKGIIVRGAASQTADLQQWQSSAGAVIAKVDTYGYITSNGAILPSGNGSFESAYGGAFMAMKKVTSAVANPVADVARMYLVAGTNAGTLKLVIKAGAAGAETTILDNIPQS